MAALSSRRNGVLRCPLSSSTATDLGGAPSVEREFERQVGTLLARGYPTLAGMDEAAFVALCEPLRGHLPALAPGSIDVTSGQVPFVLVVSSRSVPAEEAMARVVRAGKRGMVRMHPVQVADFAPISPIAVPGELIYLMTDFARGDEYRNELPSRRYATSSRRGARP